MRRDFDQWLSTFKDNIADFKYYTDFDKVYKNVSSIKIELNLLNSLINSKDIENEFRDLVKKYPSVLSVVPILLAKRGNEIKITDLNVYKNYNFKNQNYSIDDYVMFMDKTGLFELLENHLISDLTDYVKGVEVGLDSNARKNRTGTQMELLVERHLNSIGLIKDIDYYTQMTSKTITSRFGINFDLLQSGVTAQKRFDFVIYKHNKVYAIEVNFYAGGGSKLNETARSYKLLAQNSENVKNFEFIWITDGVGWFDAKNNLRETFHVLDNIFNISDLNDGLLKNILI